MEVNTTTVAYDGKILAADKQALSGHLKHTTTKIARFQDMRIGTCGTLSVGVELFEWARNGFAPEDFPEMDEDDPTFLLVVKDGEDGVWLYEGTPTPLHFEDPYFSMGSGSHIATGVMYMGGTAIEAIEAANALSSGSGCGVDFLE